MATLAAFTGVLLGTACLFDTRDARPPDTGGGGCTLDTPEAAFSCMTAAIANQQDGDYERSLSETFFFSPTVADSLDQNFAGTDVFANWGKQNKEMPVLGLLFSDALTTTASFNPSLLINKNTFVRYNVEYTLRVITESPADTTDYKGETWIDVRLENGNWRVTSWREQATVQGFSTWGFLRGILGLRLGS